MAAAYKTSSATVLGDATGAGTTQVSSSVTHATDDVWYVEAISSDNVAANCSGVVWDAAGVNEALTQVGTTTTYGTNYRSSLWRGKGLTAKTAVFTATYASSQSERLVSTIAFTGVDQTTPNGTIVVNSGGDTTALTTGAITTTVGQLALAMGAIGSGGLQYTFDAPTGTERAEGSTAGTPYDSAASQDYTAVGTSTTLNWTASATPVGWSMYGVPLNDAGAGGGGAGRLVDGNLTNGALLGSLAA